jgi:hypothetical protein
MEETEEKMNSNDLELTSNAVEDIKNRLKEIDKQKKPPIKKEDVVRSAVKVLKRETSIVGLLLDDSFEEKKLDDKKTLILEYELPILPKELLAFVKYIHNEIAKKKKEPDPLLCTWKEKLEQSYVFAEKNVKGTEEFIEIEKQYREYKRKERRSEISPFVVLLMAPIIAGFVISLVYQLPWLLFIAILSFGWEFFLLLYVFNALDKMIDSMKQQNRANQKHVPRKLRIIAWHLIIPLIAALIVSIAYRVVALGWIVGIVLFVDVMFLAFLYEDTDKT